MGKHRSGDGCLTCRDRRVKCDEKHPVCTPCERRRTCRWAEPHAKFRDYKSSKATTRSGGNRLAEKATSLTRDDAMLVNHFKEHLGRWLDCTDASRRFTLMIPEKLKLNPVLRHAVLSFAARHCGDDKTADAAYLNCINLLIERLSDARNYDETLLCTIVILQFHSQLNVQPYSEHSDGFVAINQELPGYDIVDPSAPTLREAAFWIYVRQSLFTAIQNKQPPNIGFSLRLHTLLDSTQDTRLSAQSSLETTWANRILWITACVVDFCYRNSNAQIEPCYKLEQWQEHWDFVLAWRKDRPNEFNSIFKGQTGVFLERRFVNDWHTFSFGLYHLACILLLHHKPGQTTTNRNIEGLSDTEHQILIHARAICGASKCSINTVPPSSTLCHAIFIWAPLISDPNERVELIQLLAEFQATRLWPVTWIIDTLRSRWDKELPVLIEEYDCEQPNAETVDWSLIADGLT